MITTKTQNKTKQNQKNKFSLLAEMLSVVLLILSTTTTSLRTNKHLERVRMRACAHACVRACVCRASHILTSCSLRWFCEGWGVEFLPDEEASPTANSLLHQRLPLVACLASGQFQSLPCSLPVMSTLCLTLAKMRAPAEVGYAFEAFVVLLDCVKYLELGRERCNIWRLVGQFWPFFQLDSDYMTWFW